VFRDILTMVCRFQVAHGNLSRKPACFGPNTSNGQAILFNMELASEPASQGFIYPITIRRVYVQVAVDQFLIPSRQSSLYFYTLSGTAIQQRSEKINTIYMHHNSSQVETFQVVANNCKI
jgi:hypothetical protein